MFSHWPQVDCRPKQRSNVANLLSLCPPSGLTDCLFICLIGTQSVNCWAELNWACLSQRQKSSQRVASTLETRKKRSFSVLFLMFELFITRSSSSTSTAEGHWLAKAARGESTGKGACHMTPINRFNCSLSDASYLRRVAGGATRRHRTFNVSDGSGATR